MHINARLMTIGAAVAIALGSASIAASEGASMEGAIKTRVTHMHEIGGAAKVIGDQLHADKPDVAAIQAAAQSLKDLGQALPSWFPAGSGPESGFKTRAKAEIWTDKDGFAAKAAAFKDATAKLQQLAAAGDVDGVKAQMGATGQTCGGCHGAYRAAPPAPPAAPAAPTPPAPAH